MVVKTNICVIYLILLNYSRNQQFGMWFCSFSLKINTNYRSRILTVEIYSSPPMCVFKTLKWYILGKMCKLLQDFAGVNCEKWEKNAKNAGKLVVFDRFLNTGLGFFFIFAKIVERLLIPIVSLKMESQSWFTLLKIMIYLIIPEISIKTFDFEWFYPKKQLSTNAIPGDSWQHIEEGFCISKTYRHQLYILVRLKPPFSAIFTGP